MTGHLPENPAMQDLAHLMDEWRNLTLAEQQAITAEDWAGLQALQTRKELFQQLIDKAHDQLFGNLIDRNQVAATKEHLRLMAEDLLELEQANRQLLSVKLERADQALKLMGKTSRSLRGVQRAYGGADSSFWQAYS
jgi:hypothetical protein